ncbi:hypothetical protein Ciccas_002014 [Cichlidogyrus casuarinus]|uniref:Uncharacterized protein n=1 Tax=Cichlidogyrus casuarinus TaxID=1844966 RepID=A0ABD2QLL1_9PLAT
MESDLICSEKVFRAMDNSRVTRKSTGEDLERNTSRTVTPVNTEHTKPNRRQSVLNDYKKIAITFGLNDSSDSSSSGFATPEPGNHSDKTPKNAKS